MPILPKAFDATQKIFKSIFSGRPNIFSAQDLDREVDNIHNMLLQLSLQVGPVRTNWVVNQRLQLDENDGAGNNQFTSDITVLKVDSTQPAYVFYEGIQFVVPTGDQLPYTGIFSTPLPGYPAGYLVLVATSTVVTFASNPTLAGVSSTEFPNTLPAANVVQFSNERLVYTDNPAGIALGTGEQMICIIATVVMEDESALTETTPYQLVPEFTRIVRYNAATPPDLYATFYFQQGDALATDIGLGPVQVVEPQLTNGSIIDAILLLNEYFRRKSRYLDIVNQFNNNRMGVTEANVTALQAALNALSNKVAGLVVGAGQVPVNGIIPYFGDLSNFDNTGKGVSGSVMASYAICNGLTGTPDLRGRFLVGAINQVPNVGAPGLLSEVNPANLSLPAGSNPNYTAGDKGGEAVHLLVAAENGVHDHATHGKGSIAGGSGPFFLSTTTNGAYAGAGANIFGGKTTVDPAMRTSDSTGGTPHNNLPPFFAVVYLMRIQ